MSLPSSRPTTPVSPSDAPPRLPLGPALSQRLPTLHPPEGVELRPSGVTSGGSGSAGTEARAVTSISAADLEAHFARQLTGQGWRRLNGNATGPLAWSTWTVPELAGAEGFLAVRELASGDLRILTVRIDTWADELGNPYDSSARYYDGYPYYSPANPMGPPGSRPGQSGADEE